MRGSNAASVALGSVSAAHVEFPGVRYREFLESHTGTAISVVHGDPGTTSLRNHSKGGSCRSANRYTVSAANQASSYFIQFSSRR